MYSGVKMTLGTGICHASEHQTLEQETKALLGYGKRNREKE